MYTRHECRNIQWALILYSLVYRNSRLFNDIIIIIICFCLLSPIIRFPAICSHISVLYFVRFAALLARRFFFLFFFSSGFIFYFGSFHSFISIDFDRQCSFIAGKTFLLHGTDSLNGCKAKSKLLCCGMGWWSDDLMVVVTYFYN